LFLALKFSTPSKSGKMGKRKMNVVGVQGVVIRDL